MCTSTSVGPDVAEPLGGRFCPLLLECTLPLGEWLKPIWCNDDWLACPSDPELLLALSLLSVTKICEEKG